ncbi:MAG: manganese/zinc/iron transport system permease protein [Humisphaera sp.]|nr:manganese/zinc/iron transport system permease protein [Humisphaera sp.]
MMFSILNPLSSLLAFSWHWQLDGWIVAAGILCAMSCALLGNFLVLRRMSMMGDAISHAVLPGLAIAFLVTNSRESLPMFVGAAIVGVLTALFTQWINRFGRVEESASMGVVFTSLFAIGLILIVRAADHVDLDPGCVLYGAIEMVPLDLRSVFGLQIPRAVVTLAIVFAANALFVLLFYKELKISSFDPELATTLGMNATVMHYLLMTFTAVTTVAAFESVGSILVVAMLIVPAAAAHLLTDRLWSMILLSLALAALSAVGGHVAALTVPTWFGFSDTSTAGMMAVVAGGLFTVAMLIAPRHGVISKLVHRAMLTLRIAREDILGLMYRLEEVQGGEPYTAAAAMLREGKGVGHVTSSIAVRDLLRRKQAVRSDGGFRLTDAGREAARRLVRSHRLWEGYLQKHLNLPTDHVHAPAERLEHVTDDAMREELDVITDRPETDPQGKAIPRR